jgi:hypothetical protein
VITAAVLIQAALTLVVAGPPTAPEHLPVHVAAAERALAREGRPVTLEVARTEAEAAQALAAGRAELAVTSLDSAVRLGHVKGAPPRLVLGLTAAPPVALLVPRGGTGTVMDLPDLVGRTVGIPGPGTREHRLLVALLGRAAVRASQITIASFGERGLARAVAAGQVAAAVLGDPWASRLIADGHAAALADLRRPEDRARWLGEASVESALFLRAGSRLGAGDLAPIVRGMLAGVERVRTAPAEALAAVLPASVTGERDDFGLRLEGARRIYLDGGLVSAQALGTSLARLGDRLPVPAEVKLPGPERMLFPEALRPAVGAPR